MKDEQWSWVREDLSIPEDTAEILRKMALDCECEVCGFIIDGNRIQPIVNTLSSPHAWRMDHSEMMACVNEYGDRITGIYHSHPNGRDWPSDTDAEGIAFLYQQGCPWAYLIVTVSGVSQYAYCKEGDHARGDGMGVPFGSGE